MKKKKKMMEDEIITNEKNIFEFMKLPKGIKQTIISYLIDSNKVEEERISTSSKLRLVNKEMKEIVDTSYV